MTGPEYTDPATTPVPVAHPRRRGNGHNRRVNMRTPDSFSELPLRDTKYRELERYPEFGVVTAWLRDYIRSIIPNARMSEREYWSVSCLPDTAAATTGHRLLSVHAGDLEVACLFLETPRSGERNLGGYVTVTRESLEKACGAPLDRVIADCPALRMKPHGAMVSVGWTETPDSREQFDALPWRAPARDLVTELIRTGRNRWADSHSPQIAKFAFED